MADENDRAAVLGHVAHFAEAFLLEGGVSDGEHFVYEQNFGLEVRRDCKGQTHLHAAAVMLERGIEEALDFREGDDFIELAVDFRFTHAKNGAAHVDVLAPAEFSVKAGAHLEETANAPANFGVAFSGPRDASKNLQQRALACAIAPDEPDHFALADLEADVFERPDEGRAAPVCAHARAADSPPNARTVIQTVA